MKPTCVSGHILSVSLETFIGSTNKTQMSCPVRIFTKSPVSRQSEERFLCRGISELASRFTDAGHRRLAAAGFSSGRLGPNLLQTVVPRGSICLSALVMNALPLDVFKFVPSPVPTWRLCEFASRKLNWGRPVESACAPCHCEYTLRGMECGDSDEGQEDITQDRRGGNTP
jgi:hypothetical protein